MHSADGATRRWRTFTRNDECSAISCYGWKMRFHYRCPEHVRLSLLPSLFPCSPSPSTAIQLDLSHTHRQHQSDGCARRPPSALLSPGLPRALALLIRLSDIHGFQRIQSWLNVLYNPQIGYSDWLNSACLSSQNQTRSSSTVLATTKCQSP